jgi:hypothetical protein
MHGEDFTKYLSNLAMQIKSVNLPNVELGREDLKTGADTVGGTGECNAECHDGESGGIL